MLQEIRVFLAGMLPANEGELYFLQFLSIMAFTFLSVAIALARRGDRDQIDFHYIVKNVGVGVTFPVSVLMVLCPIHPSLLTLLHNIPVYLSVVGMVGVLLAVSSLTR